ncbi:MAG: hypothetical protein WC452_06555, partial [Aminobacteriaceae bacterium]
TPRCRKTSGAENRIPCVKQHFFEAGGCEQKNAELLFSYRVLHSLSQNVKADFPARRRRVQFRAFLKRIALRTL